MGSKKVGIKEPDFCSVFSRLKEQLGIRYDREMADLLGMSENAYNTRKRRNGIPMDKLLLLCEKRAIDIDSLLGNTTDEKGVAGRGDHKPRNKNEKEYVKKVLACLREGGAKKNAVTSMLDVLSRIKK